jgi:hypothetical protein
MSSPADAAIAPYERERWQRRQRSTMSDLNSEVDDLRGRGFFRTTVSMMGIRSGAATDGGCPSNRCSPSAWPAGQVTSMGPLQRSAHGIECIVLGACGAPVFRGPPVARAQRAVSHNTRRVDGTKDLTYRRLVVSRDEHWLLPCAATRSIGGDPRAGCEEVGHVRVGARGQGR